MNLIPYMTRSFDHAGYYETRLILTLCGLAAALWFLLKRKDRSFLIMFASGTLWQAQMEYRLITGGMRGAGYNLSVFGMNLPGNVSWIFQGFAEGGILCMMSWFLVRCVMDNDAITRRIFFGFCIVIVLVASFVGTQAAGQPITSARPIINPSSMFTGISWIFAAMALVWWKDGFRQFGWYYLGTLLYVLLTFEPLHLLGARQISFKDAAGTLVVAQGWEQWRWILWSHVYEVAGTKVTYYALPLLLGLIPSGAIGKEPQTK